MVTPRHDGFFSFFQEFNMKTLTALIAASLLAGGVAFANERGAAPGGMMGGGMMGGGMGSMMNMMRHMQTMDADGDGMVSKEEFAKTHKAMFDSMPKNKEGLVDMKDMSNCPMMASKQGR